jgi:hypothetical protein
MQTTPYAAKIARHTNETLVCITAAAAAAAAAAATSLFLTPLPYALGMLLLWWQLE